MKNLKLNSRNVRNGIRKIEKLSIQKVSENSIKNIIADMIKGYKIQTPQYLEPLTIYRGRICEKPKKVSELSYPPSKFVEQYGRGNCIGQSIFYGATHSSVPFYELKCKAGDHLALSTWRTNSPLILNHIGFTEEVRGKLKSNRTLEDIYDFVINTGKYSDLNEMVHEYLGYIFSRPIEDGTDDNYFKLTSVLANIMMQADLLNGLIYPTIQMWGNADNILLKPDYVDKHLEFVNVEYIHIKENDGKGFSIDRIDSATATTVNEGTLNWSGRPLQWVLSEKGMTATFEYKADGTWVGKNQDGEIISPV